MWSFCLLSPDCCSEGEVLFFYKIIPLSFFLFLNPLLVRFFGLRFCEAGRCCVTQNTCTQSMASSAPEDLLATTLRDLVRTLVDKALTRVSFSDFKKCFPEELRTKENIPTLRKLHQRMVSGLAGAIKVIIVYVSCVRFSLYAVSGVLLYC
jgi:hypothetical protein